MTIPATGQIARTENGRQVVIERQFNAPIQDVWDSIVEPERMNRWIGTWTGTPGTGNRVQFVMTAEGQAEPEDVQIHACEAPHFLDVESEVGTESWRMSVTLTENAGVTTLVFTQVIREGDDVASYGIGWEYYLDRLVAVHTGTEFASWDDYFPGQQAHWQAAHAASQDA